MNNRILREHEAKFFVPLPGGGVLACFGAGPLENFEQRQSRKRLLTFGDINNNYYSKFSRKYWFAFGNINNNCYSKTLNKETPANVGLPLVILITIIIAKL